MPGWLSGDSTAFVRRDTNNGGSSPSPGTIIFLLNKRIPFLTKVLNN